MISPATVAILRTTEIVIAFIANILLTFKVPEYTEILGASCVFLAALSLIFEERVSKCKLWICCHNCDEANEQHA